ncbi:hypothetical protein BV898_15234 [Hypsibius exemplaris]|uniref:Cystatin domain-containing protein n=1 Tax=Hypsibius exemplaris TaxID=2072580 RepID=A0A9X6NAL5_HYPEX|nr:hypothetical protein BV898_15234 [Hypsibius exemplaris]
MSDGAKTGDEPEEMRIEVQEPVFIKANTGMICGGVNPTQHPATPEIQQKIDQYRDDVEKLHGKLEEYTAISYQDQLVNGMNYYVKVRVASSPKKHLEVSYGEPFKRDGIQGPGSFHGAIAL